ncbi:MAG: hypothetical protein R2784_15045 [Saprospiraceae bacterium]
MGAAIADKIEPGVGYRHHDHAGKILSGNDAEGAGDVEHQRIWSKKGLGDLEGFGVLRPLVNYCMPVMRTA